MSIVLEHLTKRFHGPPVVNDLCLEIADAEFFVLIGSSGSGKTTVLNLVAGLSPVDEGRIVLHGRDVTHLPPQERRVGFVFQNYALFQHMSVADNIEFALSIRKVAAAERQRRRDELLELVGLVGLGARMPRQLSGGQQQRVALARALAIRPDVLLLDEPLGALDAKIRQELRRTLHRIQRELRITTVLVTHDQDEAFELADRIGVMSFGRLLEVGTPQQLYRRPETEFVATFLGTANLLVADADGAHVALGAARIPMPGEGAGDAAGLEPADASASDRRRVQVLFRPEDVAVAAHADDLDVPRLGHGEVEDVLFSGSIERLRLRLPGMPRVRSIAPTVVFGDDAIRLEAVRPQEEVDALPLSPGDDVWLGVRRVRLLRHPGLSFLVVVDDTPEAEHALALAAQMARLDHARALVLVVGVPPDARERRVQQAKEALGSGLPALDARAVAGPIADAVAAAVERVPADLVIAGLGRERTTSEIERLLGVGDHHLLLVPRAQDMPVRPLICVASGEPGKDDVLFAGRLLRHAGARASVLAVIDAAEITSDDRARVERFLHAAVTSLDGLGVPTETRVRSGRVADAITDEITARGHDLLVVGAPLPARGGRVSLRGVVGEILAHPPRCATLIVRSAVAAPRDLASPAP